MDFLKLPPEIVEAIFLKLDTHALAACALSDRHLVKVIYSAHFLDAYCRKTLSCPWITACDIDELDIAMPFQFWFLVYSTLKIEENQGKTTLPSKLLTKIGTFRHMFIMWLVCGHRSSYLDSYALMNVLYPLPETVEDVFDSHSRPESVVLDTLMKVFYSFPEIMHISCGHLTLFQMQKCSPRKLALRQVFEQSIKPSLPKDFSLLHSVEIVSASCPSGHPTVIVLIARECWLLWLGMVSTSSEEVSVINKMFQQCFDHNVPTRRIRDRAHTSVRKLADQVFNSDGGHTSSPSGLLSGPPSLNPIISGENSDIASLVISLAQESNRSLQEKFLSIYQVGCQRVLETMQTLSQEEKGMVVKTLKVKVNQHNLIDDYILKNLQTDAVTVKLCPSSQMKYTVYKSILERLACLFRNETHLFIEHSFSHCFLCGCIGPTFPVKNGSNLDVKIEKCLSANMNDGLFSPLMWPPHVLSAACQIIPVLTDILETDIGLITHGQSKCALPFLLLSQVSQKLFISGLMLTNRPPSKPRCPPLLKQIRLYVPDVVEK